MPSFDSPDHSAGDRLRADVSHDHIANVVIEQQGNVPSRPAAKQGDRLMIDFSSELTAAPAGKDKGNGGTASGSTDKGGNPNIEHATTGGATGGRPAQSGPDVASGAVPDKNTDHSLPLLYIHHTGFWEGVGNVASELGHGAWTEITEHPGRVAADAAIGFGVGLGMTMVAPVVAAGAGLAMGGVAAYEVATHAKKWYHDASVVAKPEGHDWTELSQAKDGVQSFGGGAVDVAAGLAGGVAGAKFGQSEVFANIKDAVTDTVGQAFKASYFNAEGRPLKLPLPNNNGSAYLRYDQNGQLTNISQNAEHGWSTIMERQTNAKGVSTWMVHGENAGDGLATDPEVYQGTVALSPDNRALILDGKSGTQILSADGTSHWTQTAEQLKVSHQWAADFAKAEATIKAQLAAEGDIGDGGGAGAAAIGLGMMVR